MGGKYTRRGYRMHNAKNDANQPEIVAALERVGATVAEIGKPLDLLVGYRGVDFQLEVKNPDGKNRMEPDQVTYIDEWKGRRPVVVRSAAEALEAIGASSGAGARGVRVPLETGVP